MVLLDKLEFPDRSIAACNRDSYLAKANLNVKGALAESAQAL
ncbi:hypothetical protein [Bradyrhizobium sp. Tv2a-2]|nr:hypothetical protein [Bradyrhizobium sp. Tv2a-2]